MKKVLFATTAFAGLAIAGVASAQGIALFGDARLGLGYNIQNDGSTWLGDNGETTDDLRAVSRVRFGVNMTGETDSGITFGATIRADNASGGQGGTDGQTAGDVFVSGSWGTLTYGDTNAADEQWVGDVPGDFSLTGLGDRDETSFISNGGHFGNDYAGAFAANPAARPTVRYDFDVAGFGISASTNRDLDDIVVGTGYTADFGGGSWTIGLGYNDFTGFTSTTGVVYNDGKQWSAGLKAEYENFSFGATYVNADMDSTVAGSGDPKFQSLLVGGSFGFDAFTLGAFYGNILKAEGTLLDSSGTAIDLSDVDGDDTFAVTGQYDLGGGATVNGGVGQDYNGDTVGDFGITMAF
ncbi:MAG: porin [Amaricoccus sp.]|uniref:porin n=1 Tax=Amaricoccus sp. TaxID=1872485 RepID=UPI0039E545AA